MARRLYVGNLSFNTTELDLRDAFGQAGTITDAKVVMDRETGRPRGFAFVEMSTDQEAQDAIAQFNGRELDGRTIKVNQAEERTGGGGGGGGGNRGGGAVAAVAPAGNHPLRPGARLVGVHRHQPQPPRRSFRSRLMRISGWRPR